MKLMKATAVPQCLIVYSIQTWQADWIYSLANGNPGGLVGLGRAPSNASCAWCAEEKDEKRKKKKDVWNQFFLLWTMAMPWNLILYTYVVSIYNQSNSWADVCSVYNR